jgi:hypothetical protein
MTGHDPRTNTVTTATTGGPWPADAVIVSTGNEFS